MVTGHQLAQLRYLKQEISVERQRIAQLRAKAEYGARRLDGMPGGGRAGDRTGLYATELAYLEQLLADHMHRAVCELLRLQTIINEIPDSELRLIFYYRYIKGLSWSAIAFRIGRHDEQIPRKKHDRYLKEYNAAQKST